MLSDKELKTIEKMAHGVTAQEGEASTAESELQKQIAELTRTVHEKRVAASESYSKLCEHIKKALTKKGVTEEDDIKYFTLKYLRNYGVIQATTQVREESHKGTKRVLVSENRGPFNNPAAYGPLTEYDTAAEACRVLAKKLNPNVQFIGEGTERRPVCPVYNWKQDSAARHLIERGHAVYVWDGEKWMFHKEVKVERRAFMPDPPRFTVEDNDSEE